MKPANSETVFSETVFSEKEWLRYTRHIQLPNFGAQGQTRLKQSKVLIVGTGGLGSPVAFYLAAAGVGQLTLIDNDTVDLTNLQRQILFQQRDINKSKSHTAKQRLQQLNSDIDIIAHDNALTIDNAESFIHDADLVIDCTDNFATRYLINDVCLATKTPWLFASIFQFSGQCAFFNFKKTKQTPCFRCLFPEAPSNAPDCNQAGVLGVLPGLLGTLQANEAIKYLSQLHTPLEDHLLLVEALDLTFRKIQLTQTPGCLCTQEKECLLQMHHLPSKQQDHPVCATDSKQSYDLSPSEFKTSFCTDTCYLIDVRTDTEREAFHIGGHHYPLAQLSNHLKNLPKDQPIVCYCQSGRRSHTAVEQLIQAGFKDVYHLQGGLIAWCRDTL